MRVSLFLAVSLLPVFLAPNALADGPATPVAVAPVTQVTVAEEVPLVGSVVARRTSRISAQVEGLVEELFVEEGDEVAAGALLFRLDDKLARISVTRATAQLQEARVRLEDVRRKLKEAESLLPRRAIPETTYETAVIDVKASEAAVMRLEAELAAQQELLRRHTVRAPFGGAIVSKLGEVGQWIRTDTPVFELAEVAMLRVEVPVPQERFVQVELGRPTFVEFDAMPGQRFEGLVSRKIPSSRDAVRTFPVWIDLANDERRFAPGMSARVSLKLQGNDEVATVVPNDALVRRASGEVVVWQLRETAAGLVAVPVPVRVTRVANNRAHVVSDRLHIGDRVVVRGNETLRPEQPVRITGTMMDS